MPNDSPVWDAKLTRHRPTSDRNLRYMNLWNQLVIMAMKQYVREVSWVTGERNVHINNGILATGGHIVGNMVTLLLNAIK